MTTTMSTLPPSVREFIERRGLATPRKVANLAPSRPVVKPVAVEAATPTDPGAVIDIFVPGIAQPGGSKTATVIRRKGGAIVMVNGRPLVTTRDACKKNPEWKQTVAFFARKQYAGDPLDCPLSVRFIFTMPRPKGHYGSGRNMGVLKASAPQYHTSKPDALKLARSTEDACTGILWRDDCLTVDIRSRKIYGENPGVRIVVQKLGGIIDAHELMRAATNAHQELDRLLKLAGEMQNKTQP